MVTFQIEPSPGTPETEDATRILNWMDRHLLQTLSPKNAQAYRQYRYSTGSPAITRRGQVFPGSPQMPIPPMPVSGTGDEAYGHNRLELIIVHLIVPMIEHDELNKGLAIEIRNRCRGWFGAEYSKIDRALARFNFRNRDKDEEFVDGE